MYVQEYVSTPFKSPLAFLRGISSRCLGRSRLSITSMPKGYIQLPRSSSTHLRTCVPSTNSTNRRETPCWRQHVYPPVPSIQYLERTSPESLNPFRHTRRAAFGLLLAGTSLARRMKCRRHFRFSAGKNKLRRHAAGWPQATHAKTEISHCYHDVGSVVWASSPATAPLLTLNRRDAQPFDVGRNFSLGGFFSSMPRDIYWPVPRRPNKSLCEIDGREGSPAFGQAIVRFVRATRYTRSGNPETGDRNRPGVRGPSKKVPCAT